MTAPAVNPQGSDRRQGSGLPLPALALRPGDGGSIFCAVSPLDVRGRAADQSTIRALGWAAGARIAVATTLGAVVVRANLTGTDTLTAQGHLRLRAATLRAAQIRAGERLLLVAYLDRNLLVGYTMEHLEAMLRTSAAAGIAGVSE